MQTPPVHLSNIGQINLPVKDLDRAVSFYREQLGLEFLYQYPGLAFFNCAGVRLMLSEPEAGQKACGSTLYFQVNDFPNTVARLKAAGVQFVDDPHLIARMPDHDLWMAFFQDSEENLLALMWEDRGKRDTGVAGNKTQ